MALETMKGVEKINGESVQEVSNLLDVLNNEEEISAIIADTVHSTLFFKIQDGPIKEVGKNGCQVEDIIAVSKHILFELNQKFPCRENSMALTKLDECLFWMRERTRNRIERNVEGVSRV